MKHKLFSLIVLLMVITFCFSGCTEQRYYHENHHHSPEYTRNHPPMPPPPAVEVEIRN